MDSGGQKYRCTAADVFNDFRGRRAGVINALTVDVSKFYQLCDPEKEHLCLYGLPNETWEVNLPVDQVPPELPEPVLGINFARDFMKEKDWLALVSAHSDAWLLAVAFFFAARFNFDKETRVLIIYWNLHVFHCWTLGCCLKDHLCIYRSQLFSMINNLPTIFEVVTVANKKQTKEKTTKSSSKNKKSKSKMSRRSELHAKSSKPLLKDDEDRREEDNENDDGEHENTLCGACGENYVNDEFWICCDFCEMWFHGKCVRITPARAEYIKQYKCPSCSYKRARDDKKEG